jgi:hypothetical protein
LERPPSPIGRPPPPQKRKTRSPPQSQNSVRQAARTSGEVVWRGEVQSVGWPVQPQDDRRLNGDPVDDAARLGTKVAAACRSSESTIEALDAELAAIRSSRRFNMTSQRGGSRHRRPKLARRALG